MIEPLFTKVQPLGGREFYLCKRWAVVVASHYIGGKVRHIHSIIAIFDNEEMAKEACEAFDEEITCDRGPDVIEIQYRKAVNAKNSQNHMVLSD